MEIAEAVNGAFRAGQHIQGIMSFLSMDVIVLRIAMPFIFISFFVILFPQDKKQELALANFMTELIQDSNGIWTDNLKKVVDYPDKGNATSFELEQHSFWFIHRNQVLLEVMKRFPFDKNFADIGGGNGYQAKFLADHFPDTPVYLVEPGYKGCLNGRRRGLQNVYNTLFENFDFKRHKVTAAGMFDVVEHLEDDCGFLQQIRNRMEPGSLIYITVPAYNWLWSDADDLGQHHRRYTINSIKQLAACAGLETLYTTYFFSYLPPLTFLLRSLPYHLRGKRREESVLKSEHEQHNPSPVILRMFNYFEKRELAKIATSQVNFGASVLAVFKA